MSSINDTSDISPELLAAANIYEDGNAEISRCVVSNVVAEVAVNTDSSNTNNIVTWSELSSLLSKLESLEKKLSDLSNAVNGIILNNRGIKDLTETNTKNLINIEKYVVEQDQYSRRNNVEFRNIPEAVVQKNLENYILKLLAFLGMEINSYDIVAVHRLGKSAPGKPRNVIVRFLNRKHAYRCLSLKKKMKNTKYKFIYIEENLCRYNRRLFNALYKLKKSGNIHAVWSYNGKIFYIIDENDDNRLTCTHIDDIQFLFDNNFGTSAYSNRSNVSDSNSNFDF